jgi:hypothetical protein
VKTDVKKGEAIDNGQLTMVEDRPEGPTRMCLEIRDCHLTARNECGNSRKQADRDEKPANELDYTCDQACRVVNLTLAAEQAEQLLRTVTREKATNDDAENSVTLAGMLIQKRTHDT